MAGKRTITKLWLWGVAIMIVGGVVVLGSSLAMVAHVGNVTADHRYDFTPDDFFWAAVFFIVVGSVVAGIGAITQFVAHREAEVTARRIGGGRWVRRLRRGAIASAVVALVTFAGMVASAIANWRGGGIVAWVGFSLAFVVEWSVMVPYLLEAPDERTAPAGVRPASEVHRRPAAVGGGR